MSTLLSTYLELTACACNTDSGLVAHDLRGNHGKRLALGWVDLSGHDTATRLVLGQAELTETAARTRAKVADVVGDLHQRASNDVESTVSFDQGIVGG